MMDTERLYAQRDEASKELEDIREREKRLLDQINTLIEAFADDHGCSIKSVHYAIEYTADALADLFDDAEGPAYRRMTCRDVQIGKTEEADLRRSVPVVL